jgi:hypothetical protein
VSFPLAVSEKGEDTGIFKRRSMDQIRKTTHEDFNSSITTH